MASRAPVDDVGSANNGMLKHRNITVERLEKYVQSGQFDDVNMRTFLWSKKRADAVKLSVYAVPDLKRIPFEEAMKGTFVETRVGEMFGPSWATFWFKVTATIPADWDGDEVLLLFDPDCEGMVWSTDGHPLQGLTGEGGGARHVDYRLTKTAKAGEVFELFIETACNGLFGNAGGGIFPPSPNNYYRLKTAELAVQNKLGHHVWYDFEILLGMVKELPWDSQAGCDALYTANKIVNILRHDQPETLVEAHKVARQFFAARSNMGMVDHEIIAVGNCHIDTAWLWPFDETKRKAARSFATQITLADEFPDYKFTHSQAQQWEWVEGLYPSLFERIKEKVKNGQFAPVGGTWVEMDCNMPSGEALCRQFLYGQRFFESRFGQRCKVFWLPDTFGYSAQLPQIVHLSGLKYFFTQKLSWNNINRFPNTTFMWTGLDGTSVLTHFSPADTYGAQVTVRDVAYSVRNNKDKEYTNRSLLCYGNGDGGGGPLKAMIERLNRLKSVEGLPAKVRFGSANEFFEELEATSRDLVSWKGELYFELHRGTYTSQARNKRYNRKSEYLLREVEFLSSLACLTPHSGGSKYVNPKAELDRLWKLVLLNQFHDVLPGSSIEMVYSDAIKFYEDVEKTGNKLRQDALDHLQKALFSATGKSAISILNTTSWPIRQGVIELNAGAAGSLQQAADGKALVMIDNVPSMSLAYVNPGNQFAGFVPVTVTEAVYETTSDVVDPDYEKIEKVYEIINAYVVVRIDQNGRLISIFDRKEQRECIAPGKRANVFRLYEDIPLYWDAWDVEVYHLEKGWNAGIGVITIEEAGPVRVVLKVVHAITKNSTVEQRIILTAASSRIDFDTTVKWDENRVFLKVEFPLNVLCDYATYESQFGYIQRPTHYNNSWDMARFEVCGHKYADLSEAGYGVAIINDSKYGYACRGNVMRLSLLRSAKAPDLHADIGTHTFKYAIYPHKHSFLESDVVREAYQFNVSPIAHPSLVSFDTMKGIEFFSLDKTNVVVDTVKVAEDPRSKEDLTDIVIRLYEAYGGRGTLHLKTPFFAVEEANFCNVLEDIEAPVEHGADGALLVPFKPFKVISLRLLVRKL
ncbi:glycosyl hydrolases family 38 N-terminal domain-containing protein [Zopfochytrium polystomum]|nr:glycosyl hydrolases family 38 N-terminal domain-containing protein [Zopfochytrium polystomum]